MKPHVLLVEDDHMARLTLARRLQHAGYRVTQASDGETAIALLEEETFEVVLTDMVLGDVSGIDVLQAAKRQPDNPAVILLTGHGSLDTSLNAFRGGAYDYLLKPCPPDELLACVDRACQRYTTEQKLREAAMVIYGHAGGKAPPDTETPSSRGTPLASSPPRARSICIGELSIGKSRRDVFFQGEPVHLTPIEYALLRYLAETPGQSRKYGDIVFHTHGGCEMSNAEAQGLVKPHIHNLRKKLSSGYLRNDRGTGYMLVDPTSW